LILVYLRRGNAERSISSPTSLESKSEVLKNTFSVEDHVATRATYLLLPVPFSPPRLLRGHQLVLFRIGGHAHGSDGRQVCMLVELLGEHHLLVSRDGVGDIP
jgi:hypothetical protein